MSSTAVRYDDQRALFCDTALARRIERAEAELMRRVSLAAHARTGGAGFVVDIAGGVASFADHDSPFNKVAGLGFAGVPTDADLDRVEAAFGDLGVPVQVELATLGDPALPALLTARGYRLLSYENVLGRALREQPARVTPPGIEVRRSGAAEFDAWLDVVVEGVAHPDTQGVPSHEDFPREAVAAAERDFDAAGVLRYLALRDGQVAGGASIHVIDGIAQMGGAATAPAHRRRGIQSALLAARLADAVAAGCDIAVVTTQPGSPSQQNVQRQGFHLLYTRAVLVRTGGSRHGG
jgi:GNAT superfamily N-acetyltransferase